MFKVDADPGEVGLDPDRLRRLDDAFRSYVDDGRLPGWTLAVTRRGKVAHLTHHGLADLDSGRPVGDDTLWRIYSMTKPITSVAAMMLYEQGLFELTDPVSKFIPEFADARVYVGGAAAAPGTRPAVEPIRVWHLLTHTAVTLDNRCSGTLNSLSSCRRLISSSWLRVNTSSDTIVIRCSSVSTLTRIDWWATRSPSGVSISIADFFGAALATAFGQQPAQGRRGRLGRRLRSGRGRLDLRLAERALEIIKRHLARAQRPFENLKGERPRRFSSGRLGRSR